MAKSLQIVGLGGTLRPVSSGAAALRLCLESARSRGCEVTMLTGFDLDLPMYDPSVTEMTARAAKVVEILRAADGIIVASPGYHGGISGLVKNALDYTEALREDARCYLTDVPVGCIVSAAGWQAGGSTLGALRAVVHALRGWPTPPGVVFNSKSSPFNQEGQCEDRALTAQLHELTNQVVTMAHRLTRSPSPVAPRNEINE